MAISYGVGNIHLPPQPKFLETILKIWKTHLVLECWGTFFKCFCKRILLKLLRQLLMVIQISILSIMVNFASFSNSVKQFSSFLVASRVYDIKSSANINIFALFLQKKKTNLTLKLLLIFKLTIRSLNHPILN